MTYHYYCYITITVNCYQFLFASLPFSISSSLLSLMTDCGPSCVNATVIIVKLWLLLVAIIYYHNPTGSLIFLVPTELHVLVTFGTKCCLSSSWREYYSRNNSGSNEYGSKIISTRLTDGWKWSRSATWHCKLE